MERISSHVRARLDRKAAHVDAWEWAWAGGGGSWSASLLRQSVMNGKDDQGKQGKWRVELGGPSELARYGWSASTLKPGNV